MYALFLSNQDSAVASNDIQIFINDDGVGEAKLPQDYPTCYGASISGVMYHFLYFYSFKFCRDFHGKPFFIFNI